ncbi:hypothetical protein PACILC2_21630 [Paenibacillus cisolokensis]|uniref:Resolvase HTH domain-containing protein n=1 Tax=Paenibacillus cisolokensis TaxID=1658519 RepID=A0ABQ4N5Z8_9BACL|nr:hypothetical protein [Paenibacillus cisolokensis]GIQ63595.1 hypothetical protein PACILC2_21630 [Paenibacillus cisolokensis]
MITKIWRLTPEQIADYKPGMDLGEPHEVKDVPVIVYISDLDEAKRRAARGNQTKAKRKSLLTARLYDSLRRDGYSDQEIAKQYGIKHKTLTAYKSLWRKREEL